MLDSTQTSLSQFKLTVSSIRPIPKLPRRSLLILLFIFDVLRRLEHFHFYLRSPRPNWYVVHSLQAQKRPLQNPEQY